ncbi:DNA starvation/stationary phase protection protein Dps [Tessaracoccus caeni]|uniref:DNA starvation/stationary phase protection protein Dps n=1 Tax=Tessaracoccus caeni TaxID=3031239 RepID=UPI0023DA7280|nr:DNA starvation/stationary phase protection protein Dps [Tessaracoccus caeni]MDF1486905.1 DNA starvation/stationary phase protection protein Dps [Tessaracoccus caeni]
MAKKSTYTVPGLSEEAGQKAVEILQGRLNEYNDLQLTLKHVHWNVVGPNFISVHEMIDPQVDLVRLYADAAAERIAALGGSPRGTVGGIAEDRALPEYPLGRNTALEHLKALDGIYDVVITDNREAITALEELDVVTQDMVIGQTAELEKFQWFVRAHLENAGGQLPQ